MMKLTEEDIYSPKDKSIRDGGHTLLCCSDCDKPLVDIWVTRPDEKTYWKVRAKCCYCGGLSYIKDIVGGFTRAGYGEECLADPLMNIPKVDVVDYEYEKDQNGKQVVIFVTQKARDS